MTPATVHDDRGVCWSSTMTAAVFGSPLSNLLPSGGYGRLAEVRAVVGFILSFLVPAFVPFLREPAPFLLYLAGVAYLANKHKTGPSCGDSPDLTGKVIVVTGGNTGIGRETALRFAQLGANLVLACRSAERTAAALAQLRAVTKAGQTVEFIRLDLASFDSVRQFATDFQARHGKLDVLVNNAGIMMCPFELTADGHESQFQSNHLGHFLLTLLMTRQLEASGGGRVVNVASEGHKMASAGSGPEVIERLRSARTYDKPLAYAVSKLANIQFAYELNHRYAKAGLHITAYSVHPGVVDTELMRHFPKVAMTLVSPFVRLLLKTSAEGAQTSIHAALSNKAVPGQYHMDCSPQQPSRHGYDVAQATALWTHSVHATGLGQWNFG